MPLSVLASWASTWPTFSDWNKFLLTVENPLAQKIKLVCSRCRWLSFARCVFILRYLSRVWGWERAAIGWYLISREYRFEMHTIFVSLNRKCSNPRGDYLGIILTQMSHANLKSLLVHDEHTLFNSRVEFNEIAPNEPHKKQFGSTEIGNAPHLKCPQIDFALRLYLLILWRRDAVTNCIHDRTIIKNRISPTLTNKSRAFTARAHSPNSQTHTHARVHVKNRRQRIQIGPKGKQFGMARTREGETAEYKTDSRWKLMPKMSVSTVNSIVWLLLRNFLFLFPHFPRLLWWFRHAKKFVHVFSPFKLHTHTYTTRRNQISVQR